MFWVGCGAFLLFFLGDFNDVKLHSRILCISFPLGVCLMTLASVDLCRAGYPPVYPFPIWIRVLFFTIGALFFALNIHALFFAIPVGKSYGDPGAVRETCTQGVYALCRHPGIIWFAFFYLFLSLSLNIPLYCATVYIALNAMLALFEDVYVFPRLLSGYAGYRKSTPFLLPNRKSISLCLRHYLKRDDQTEKSG